jgi:hypothetical protein
LYRLLPAERKGEWVQYLAQTADPVGIAVAQAESVLRTNNDLATLRKVEAWLTGQAPESPELLQVQALLQEGEGEYEQAAALYRQAAEQSSDESAQQNRWWRYLTAMQSAGKLLEAVQEHPESDRAFEIYASGFEEDEAILPLRELRPLVAVQLARNPEHRLANLIAGELAQRAGDFAAATKHLEQVTAGETVEEDYLRSQAESSLLHIAVQQGRALAVLRQAKDQAVTYQGLAGAALNEKDWQTLQQLNNAVRNTPTAQQNAWFHYYEAKLALQAKQTEVAVQQMLFAKIQGGEGPQNSGKYYIDYLEAEILGDAYGLLEAYQKAPNQVAAFSRYHYQALNQHDWATAAALCALHKQAHADDPQLLAAEYGLALQQGKYADVVTLLQPFPEVERLSGEWQISQAREALVLSLIHLQRFDEAAAAIQAAGHEAAKLQTLLHLMKGDAAALRKLQAERRKSFPHLLGTLFSEYPHELASWRKDPRLADIFREFGVPPRDELNGAGIVLLSAETNPWTVDALRERLATAIPGVQIGAAREHACGVSYPLVIPGGEPCRFQLTIGNAPYTTTELVNDEVILPMRLRPVVEQQRSWLAIESSAPQPTSAIDGPWRRLRQLTAALCDPQVLAVGYREPSDAQTVFVLYDAELPAILQSEKHLQRALDNQPSSALPFAPRKQDEQTKGVQKQVQQFARQWRTGTAKPPTEVRVPIDLGHRGELAWFRVIDIHREPYTGDVILGELIPSPAIADFLPAGRYQLPANVIRELRPAE